MATLCLVAMATPTTNEARDALSGLSTAEIEESDLSGGLRVAVDESEAGLLFREIRVRGFNAQSKRLGDTIVSHIETNDGLGELFG